VNVKEWFKEWVGAVIGAVLIALGIVGLIYLHQYEIAKDLCETAILAGVVTLTVDPFLKRRLAKEASRNIFHYLLGFDLPEEIRESLTGHLKNTRHYREDLEMEVQVTPHGQDKAAITISQRSKVVAVKDCEYVQELNFEESECGQILEVSVTGNRDTSMDYQKRNVPLKKDSPEPWVYTWKGPPIDLKKEERITAYARFTVIRGRSDFFTMNFAAPVVRPRVHILDSEGFSVIASATPQRNGSFYIYRKVFLPADHIQVRWKPKD
jgi:hypothetical protein